MPASRRDETTLSRLASEWSGEQDNGIITIRRPFVVEFSMDGVGNARIRYAGACDHMLSRVLTPFVSVDDSLTYHRALWWQGERVLAWWPSWILGMGGVRRHHDDKDFSVIEVGNPRNRDGTRDGDIIYMAADTGMGGLGHRFLTPVFRCDRRSGTSRDTMQTNRISARSLDCSFVSRLFSQISILQRCKRSFLLWSNNKKALKDHHDDTDRKPSGSRAAARSRSLVHRSPGGGGEDQSPAATTTGPPRTHFLLLSRPSVARVRVRL
jgi:hypothetical protein